MSVNYDATAGYGVMFTGEEVVQFVKDHGIEYDDDYCWECAEAVSLEYKLNFGYAGDSMTGSDMYFLFGAIYTIYKTNQYDDNQFRFNEISVVSLDEAAALDKLSADSGKSPAYYVGMHVG